jgi:peptidoglycan/LPS O-acetylase OafA/YrhL
MNGHIKWIDGLKGLACILVFWHHFCLAFLPGIHFGAVVPSHIAGGYDVGLAQSPLSFVLNGNFMVAVFCVLSGFVLSVKTLRSEEPQIARMIVKRYPRLMLPVVPVGIAVYFMLRFQLFFNQQVVPVSGSPWFAGYYIEPVSVDRLLYALIAGIWFQGDDSLSTAFWMLRTLFLGSFAAILLSIAAKHMKKHAGLFLCCCMGVMMFANDMLWAFALSALLAYGHVQKTREHSAVPADGKAGMTQGQGAVPAYGEAEMPQGHGAVPEAAEYGKSGRAADILKTCRGIVCVVAGCVLGGYPSGGVPTNAYRFLNIFPAWYHGFMLLHIAGAGLLVYGLLCLKRLPALLGNRLFLFLGKISYAVYLVHIPLLFSLSAYVFLQAQGSGLGYLRSTAVSFVVSNVVLVGVAFLYHQIVERPCAALTNRLCRESGQEETKNTEN